MEYWTALLLGLVGSTHCAGMCGPLTLALPNGGNSRISFFSGRLAYNIGRVMTYSLLGLVFGSIGGTVSLAGWQQALSIALGLALLVGLFCTKQNWLAAATSGLVTRLKTRMGRVLKSRTHGGLVMLGLLNGLLPCGLVYVAGAGAAATGSVLHGLGYMAAFGAGTIPLMLAISLSGRMVPLSWRLKLQRMVPVFVFLAAMLLILRGLGLGVPFISPGPTAGSCCRLSP